MTAVVEEPRIATSSDECTQEIRRLLIVEGTMSDPGFSWWLNEERSFSDGSTGTAQQKFNDHEYHLVVEVAEQTALERSLSFG